MSCSKRVHRVARHAAVFPGVGIAARPGPPAPGGLKIRISNKHHTKKD